MEKNMNSNDISFSIKKSILSLIGNLVIIETIFLIVFSLISIFLEDSLVNASIDRDAIIFIDVTTTLILSLLQTVVILLIAYSWHNREIKINKSNIVYISGFWKISTEIILFSEIADVITSSNVFQEMLNIGSVTFTLHEKSKKLSFNNIDRFSDYINNLNAIKSITKKEKQKIPSIEKLIEGGENDTVEFKSSLYYDLITKQPNKTLTEIIMKSIVGFLNNQGGNIIVGIDDNGKIIGLKNDYQNYRKENADGFEQYFNNVFIQMIGAEYRTYVKLIFHKIDEQEICIIRILQSNTPVFLKRNDAEEFFLRTGNTTNPLKTREMYNYISLHW